MDVQKTLILCIIFFGGGYFLPIIHAQKPNLIITTDLGQDPDDQQSMVRLLHYANEFNLLGLITNADGNYDHEPPELRTDILYELLEAYSTIYPNLRKVDSAFPTVKYLKSLVKEGCQGNGRDIPVQNYIGEGKSTEGSDWIINMVDLAKEPVYISVWGGSCDLAQALFDVRNTRTDEELYRFLAKLRVYFIGLQDSSNPWIMENFPELKLVLGMSYDGNSWNSSYRGIFLGGDMQLTSREWLHQYVIGQQALGNMYPDKAWTKGGSVNPHGAMKEGDTPSFLFCLPNDLNHPEHPEWGGWGGRFQMSKRDFYRDAEDTFLDVSTDSIVTHAKATIFRWRPDIQADFAARVQWGKGHATTINHYPTVQIEEDRSSNPLYIDTEAGSLLTLDAGKSYDQDGDQLIYEWILYPEAGTYSHPENLILKGSDESKLSLRLPQEGQGEIHLILRVKDDAQFPLTSYKRLIIRVESEIPLIILDTDMGSDCDDVGAMALLHQYVNQGKARLLGSIYSSGKVPYGAGIIDAINTYYGRPDSPIGAEYDENFGDPLDKMNAAELAKDTAAFGHDVIHNRDLPHHVMLNRKLLAQQKDTSVTYITIGHTKALHDLLKSEADSISHLTGMELVRKKVKKWVALGGLKANNPNGYGSKDWNFFRNNTQSYTDYLLEYFPRPVYLINAGSDVFTGQSLALAKEGTIVRAAYKSWLWKVEKKNLSDGRPSWDLAAVCFAVEGQGRFFDFPEPGILHFDTREGSRWQKLDGGQHFYVNQKAGVSLAFANYLNQLIMKE